MYDIPCVIFAGGKSSRMGEDKALLPFASYTTLTEYQYQRLSELFNSVYISTKNPSKFLFKANFLVDNSQDNYSPLNGFLTLFEQLQTESVFVISVDTPFISDVEIKMLLQADTKENDATVAQTDNKVHPLCGVYHRSLYPKISKMFQEDKHKLTQLLNDVNTAYVSFENERAFLNLNRPHEYEEALQLLNS